MAEEQYTTANVRAMIRATFGPEQSITGRHVRLVRRFLREVDQARRLGEAACRRSMRSVVARTAREWEGISLAHVRPHD